MSVAQRQAVLIDRYSAIPDPHERLAAIVARKTLLPPVLPEERTEANLVPGCQSRVWIVGSYEAGRCRFRMDAESALVKGLVSLICELYDDAPPHEISSVEPAVLEALGIARHLSPTRLNGLASVRGAIRQFAVRCPLLHLR